MITHPLGTAKEVVAALVYQIVILRTISIDLWITSRPQFMKSKFDVPRGWMIGKMSIQEWPTCLPY